MEEQTILVEALKYPLQGSTTKRHLLGGVLILFSWLLLPFIILVGYYIHIITYISIGNKDIPKISDYKTLITNGTIGTIIIFTYTGFFIAAPLLTTMVLAERLFDPQGTADIIFIIDSLFYILATFTLITAGILPIVLCRYGQSGNFSACYDLTTLVRLLQRKRIMKTVAITYGIGAVTTILFTVLTVVTFGLTLFLIPLIIFWFALVSAFLYGNAIGIETGTITPTVISETATKTVETNTSESNNET